MNKSVQLELLNHIKQTIIDQELTDLDELHYHCFNEDFYIIGYFNARQWLLTHEVSAWDCTETVQDYEKDNFGEVSTAINSEAMVNMYVYILGEQVINDLELDEDSPEGWANIIDEAIEELEG